MGPGHWELDGLWIGMGKFLDTGLVNGMKPTLQIFNWTAFPLLLSGEGRGRGASWIIWSFEWNLASFFFPMGCVFLAWR